VREGDGGAIVSAGGRVLSFNGRVLSPSVFWRPLASSGVLCCPLVVGVWNGRGGKFVEAKIRVWGWSWGAVGRIPEPGGVWDVKELWDGTISLAVDQEKTLRICILC